jgi:ribose/xylose/arabinose/galactoside ABC-type transport system permease subunit
MCFHFTAGGNCGSSRIELDDLGTVHMALGKNQEAARYAGINTGRMIVVAYLLCAVFKGLGGILHGVDANSISPSSFGNFFELYAIAAAVLGGCSLRGGEEAYSVCSLEPH